MIPIFHFLGYCSRRSTTAVWHIGVLLIHVCVRYSFMTYSSTRSMIGKKKKIILTRLAVVILLYAM